MYKILIADDEPVQLRVLQHYCEQLGLFDTIDTATDALAATKHLAEKKYDLLLLDINMPILSGISLARTLTQNTPVIFITAYSEYAVEAFDLQALDYLLKPVSFERFVKAIQRLFTLNKAQQHSPAASLVLKQGAKTFHIIPETIRYLEAQGNLSRIFLPDAQSIDVYMPLAQLLAQLDPSIFLQVHRSFIVNINQVLALDRHSLYLKDNTAIPIGNSYRKEVELHWNK